MKKILVVTVLLLFAANFTLAQSKLGLQINGVANLPQGDMGDILSTGFGGEAGLTYDLSSSFQLGVLAGYYTFAFDNSVFDGTPLEGQEIDASTNIIPLMATARYFFSKSSFSPYANAKLGLQFLSVTGDDVPDNTESETETGWGVGLGFLINAGKNLNIDINASFNGTSAEFGQSTSSTSGGVVTEESSSSTGTWLGISAGVHIGL